MNLTRAFALAGLVTGAFAQSVPAGGSFAPSPIGRLFSSPQQRLELDRVRDDPGSAQVTTPILEPSRRQSRPESEHDAPALAATLDGVVVRSDGHWQAWIDGNEATVDQVATTGVRLEVMHTPGGRLRVRLTAGRTSAVLEPGQSVDENGKVRAAYERRPATFAVERPGEGTGGPVRADRDAGAPVELQRANSTLPPADRLPEQPRATRAGSDSTGKEVSGARDSVHPESTASRVDSSTIHKDATDIAARRQ